METFHSILAIVHASFTELYVVSKRCYEHINNHFKNHFKYLFQSYFLNFQKSNSSCYTFSYTSFLHTFTYYQPENFEHYISSVIVYYYNWKRRSIHLLNHSKWSLLLKLTQIKYFYLLAYFSVLLKISSSGFEILFFQDCWIQVKSPWEDCSYCWHSEN